MYWQTVILRRIRQKNFGERDGSEKAAAGAGKSVFPGGDEEVGSKKNRWKRFRRKHFHW